MINSFFTANARQKMNTSNTYLSSYIEPIYSRRLLRLIPVNGNGGTVTTPVTFKKNTFMKPTNIPGLVPVAASVPEKLLSTVKDIFQMNFINVAQPDCSEDHILSLVYGCLS